MATSDPNAVGGLYCPACETTYTEGVYCPVDHTRLVDIAPAVDELIGRDLDGRYRVLDRIGDGGMGAVYRGRQHSVGRDCAIKVINPALVREPTTIMRFLREARLASQLAHPNVVSVLDCGQTADGVFFLIMELLGGRTLDKVLVEEGRLPPDRVIRIGIQICDALEAAHGRGIAHRDLKPANVMLMARDLVKVLDFGLAKSLSPDAGGPATQAGALLGTPGYMPPELINAEPHDARTDLYSLGCMLYELASGRLPYEAATTHAQLAMHLGHPTPRLKGVPPELAAAVERLMAKAPADRFATAALARHALEHAQGVDDSLDSVGGFGATLLGWSGTLDDTVRSTAAELAGVTGSSSADPPPTTPLARRLAAAVPSPRITPIAGRAASETDEDDAEPTIPEPPENFLAGKRRRAAQADAPAPATEPPPVGDAQAVSPLATRRVMFAVALGVVGGLIVVVLLALLAG